MKSAFLFAIGMTLSLSALAQTATAPKINAGDTWTYRETTEKGTNGWTQNSSVMTVERVTASNIYYTGKLSNSTQPGTERITGADWRLFRDIDGKETVVNQPLNFPLTPGKKWQTDYTVQHPNKAHRSEQWSTEYTVVGFETVEVPAGKFNAIKVEAEGHWTAVLEPTQTVVMGSQSQQSNTTMVTQVQRNTASTASGRTYKAYWYVPEVKRFVKGVEETYANTGVRSQRFTTELESVKVTE